MAPRAELDRAGDVVGPHPLRRAVVALLLGAALGVAVALLRPRCGAGGAVGSGR